MNLCLGSLESFGDFVEKYCGYDFAGARELVASVVQRRWRFCTYLLRLGRFACDQAHEMSLLYGANSKSTMMTKWFRVLSGLALDCRVVGCRLRGHSIGGRLALIDAKLVLEGVERKGLK